MTDYSELVKALRCCISKNPPETCVGCTYSKCNNECAVRRMMLDAASAIEALEARLGEAENSVERWKDMYLTKHEPKLGKWIGKSDDDSLVKCSVCGHIRIGSSLWYCKQYVPYCENCGAKMDGEWENWNPKKIWVPSKKGLGMGKVFDMANEIYGKDFYRYE